MLPLVQEVVVLGGEGTESQQFRSAAGENSIQLGREELNGSRSV